MGAGQAPSYSESMHQFWGKAIAVFYVYFFSSELFKRSTLVSVYFFSSQAPYMATSSNLFQMDLVIE